jgi:hypothetical protein
MRSPFQCERARLRCQHENGQDSLQYERRAARRPHGKFVFTGSDVVGSKGKLLRAEFIAADFRPADLSRRSHGCEMLPLQTRLLAPRPDILNPKRRPRRQAQRQRRPQNLPPALVM